MHRISLVVAILSGMAFGQALVLGTRLDQFQMAGTKTTRCVTAPSQTWSCTDIVVRGARFKMGYDDKTHAAKYLFTDDPGFKTSDGLHTGSWLEVRERDLVLVPGWRIYGPKTKDGWRTVIGTPFRFNNQTERLELSALVRFADGTTVDLSRPASQPARAGRVKILGFEKGGAVQ
jgi:hypothetical protein